MRTGTVYDTLIARYSEAEKPLVEREAANSARHERTLKILQEVETIEAKLAVLSRHIEETIAKGDASQAGKLKLERQALAESKGNLRVESDTLLHEIKVEEAAISHMRGDLAKRVLHETFPMVRAQVHKKVEEAVVALDGAWNDLLAYEKATRPCLSISAHRGRLAPSDVLTDDDEKRLARRVQYWFA